MPRSAKRETEITENAGALRAPACVPPPGSNISRSQGLHCEHGWADVATPFAHGRDSSVSHGEPGFRHLRHQSVETDAPVAKALRRDHRSVSLPSVRQIRKECWPETVIPRTSSGRKPRSSIAALRFDLPIAPTARANRIHPRLRSRAPGDHVKSRGPGPCS